MGSIFDGLDKDKQAAVSKIAEAHKINLQLATIVHAASPSINEAELVKVLKATVENARTEALKAAGKPQNAATKAELEKKINDLQEAYTKAADDGRVAQAIAFKNRLTKAIQEFKALGG